MRFERGVTIGDMRVCEELESELWGEEAVDELIKGRKTGTEVRFLPDDTVFKDKKGKPGIIFDREILEKRIDEIAYLNAGLTVTLLDERGKKPIKKVFYHAGGLAEYVGLLCEGKTPLFQISSAKGAESGFVQEGATITLTSTIDDVSASVALRWSSDQYAESILSFCNNIRTRDGGSHVEALKTTLTRTINNLGRSRKQLKDKNLPGDYIREGLTAIISVSLPDPEFEGQTKSRLGNPEIRALDAVLVNQFTSLFDFHPTILEKIIEKANQALNAANAARAARELVRRKSSLTSTILPGKLADCANRDPAESEIFIVEGDNAGGRRGGHPPRPRGGEARVGGHGGQRLRRALRQGCVAGRGGELPGERAFSRGVAEVPRRGQGRALRDAGPWRRHAARDARSSCRHPRGVDQGDPLQADGREAQVRRGLLGAPPRRVLPQARRGARPRRAAGAARGGAGRRRAGQATDSHAPLDAAGLQRASRLEH